MIGICTEDYSEPYWVLEFKKGQMLELYRCIKFNKTKGDPNDPWEKDVFCYFTGTSRGASSEIHLPKTHFIVIEWFDTWIDILKK
jgi:hypothetical protein